MDSSVEETGPKALENTEQLDSIPESTETTSVSSEPDNPLEQPPALDTSHDDEKVADFGTSEIDLDDMDDDKLEQLNKISIKSDPPSEDISTKDNEENADVAINDFPDDMITEGPMNDVDLDDDKQSFEEGMMDEINLDDDNGAGQIEVSGKASLPQPVAPVLEVPSVPQQERSPSPVLQVSDPAPINFVTGPVPEQGSIQLKISVTSPHKVGDGMSSYMAYKVKTSTNLPSFKKKELSVTRRFSDFLGLRDKLNDKYMRQGRIIPPAPDKSVIGMTKVKMSKEEDKTDQSEFIEKRRAALERYLNRTGQHLTLREDPDFREFLELNTELPKANHTAALSGKSMMKMFSKMGDKVVNYNTKMEEKDQWFEEKTVMVDNLDSQLRKLLLATESLVDFRKGLAGHTYSVSKSIASLGHTEEDTKLSAALDQLADVFMNIQKVYDDQSKDDLFLLSEMVHDYLGLVTAIKDVLAERIKAWQHWQTVEKDLNRKRDQKVKLEVAGKTDKVNELKAMIVEAEKQLDSAQENFDKISSTIKKEIEVFESAKCEEWKSNLVLYLEKMLQGQDTVAGQWERYLPEIKQCGA